MTKNLNHQLIKIVIIDDDPDDVLLVKDYLSDIQMISLEITVCETYQKGWNEIVADQGDVYLIDQHLGAEKGVSLIARARDRGIQKPMILMTGNDSLEVDYEAQQAMATDYVFKGDLKPSILARAIRYSLVQWQALEHRERYLQERIARKQAEDLERRKSDFLKIASHELKTPITSTLSSMYLLREVLQRQKCAESQVYLDRMHRQLNHLTNMVEDLLDLSKIEMDQLTVRPEIINLSELVLTVVQDLASTTKHDIKYEMPSEDIYIQADPARINQVLTNLIANAIQYSPIDREINIDVIAKEDAVEIIVVDHGVGISAKNLEQIFNKFFSSQGNIVNKDPGLGLGLYLSKHIVDLHKGSITASSQLGKGTTFIVQLPIEQKLSL